MHCKFCGFGNGEDDHRCLRCGRRIGVAIAAPAGYRGNTALALAPLPEPHLREDDAQELKPEKAAPLQPVLFAPPAPNVIPFDQIQRQTGRFAVVDTRIEQPAAQTVAQPSKPAPSRPSGKKHPGVTAEQGSLDFIPFAPSKARTLKTSVEAVIFCDQPVATPMHRFIAASIDASIIVLGFGLFLLAFQVLGGHLGSGKALWITLGTSLAAISMFYGLIWAIAGGETAGMRLTDLQLITFDGFPVDARSRALRFLSTWLSFCSGSLGLLWALADEENLTWHDHISKTFPTVREIPRTFVRQRKS